MTKREMVDFLKVLLRALSDTEPPAKTPPKPPPNPPPAPTPALGHTPYIKADYSMCCPAHEETAFQPATEVRWIVFR